MAAKWGHADVPLADAAGVATGAGHAHPSGGLSAPEGSAACFFHADCRVLAQLLRRVTHEPTFQEAGALSLYMSSYLLRVVEEKKLIALAASGAPSAPNNDVRYGDALALVAHTGTTTGDDDGQLWALLLRTGGPGRPVCPVTHQPVPWVLVATLTRAELRAEGGALAAAVAPGSPGFEAWAAIASGLSNGRGGAPACMPAVGSDVTLPPPASAMAPVPPTVALPVSGGPSARHRVVTTSQSEGGGRGGRGLDLAAVQFDDTVSFPLATNWEGTVSPTEAALTAAGAGAGGGGGRSGGGGDSSSVRAWCGDAPLPAHLVGVPTGELRRGLFHALACALGSHAYALGPRRAVPAFLRPAVAAGTGSGDDGSERARLDAYSFLALLLPLTLDSGKHVVIAVRLCIDDGGARSYRFAALLGPAEARAAARLYGPINQASWLASSVAASPSPFVTPRAFPAAGASPPLRAAGRPHPAAPASPPLPPLPPIDGARRAPVAASGDAVAADAGDGVGLWGDVVTATTQLNIVVGVTGGARTVMTSPRIGGHASPGGGMSREQRAIAAAVAAAAAAAAASTSSSVTSAGTAAAAAAAPPAQGQSPPMAQARAHPAPPPGLSLSVRPPASGAGGGPAVSAAPAPAPAPPPPTPPSGAVRAGGAGSITVTYADAVLRPTLDLPPPAAPASAASRGPASLIDSTGLNFNFNAAESGTPAGPSPARLPAAAGAGAGHVEPLHWSAPTRPLPNSGAGTQQSTAWRQLKPPQPAPRDGGGGGGGGGVASTDVSRRVGGGGASADATNAATAEAATGGAVSPDRSQYVPAVAALFVEHDRARASANARPPPPDNVSSSGGGGGSGGGVTSPSRASGTTGIWPPLPPSHAVRTPTQHHQQQPLPLHELVVRVGVVSDTRRWSTHPSLGRVGSVRLAAAGPGAPAVDASFIVCDVAAPGLNDDTTQASAVLALRGVSGVLQSISVDGGAPQWWLSDVIADTEAEPSLGVVVKINHINGYGFAQPLPPGATPEAAAAALLQFTRADPATRGHDSLFFHASHVHEVVPSSAPGAHVRVGSIVTFVVRTATLASAHGDAGTRQQRQAWDMRVVGAAARGDASRHVSARGGAAVAPAAAALGAGRTGAGPVTPASAAPSVTPPRSPLRTSLRPDAPAYIHPGSSAAAACGSPGRGARTCLGDDGVECGASATDDASGGGGGGVQSQSKARGDARSDGPADAGSDVTAAPAAARESVAEKTSADDGSGASADMTDGK